MPRPEYEPMSYLSKRGRRIFFSIINHINSHDLMQDIDVFQLSMLANSFDIYEQMANMLNAPSPEGGFIHAVTGKNGTFNQVRPEYGIMKNEYDKIMKLSPSYGLNPGDRQKIFDGLKNKKKALVSDGLD